MFRPGPLGSLARLAFRYRGRTVLLWLTAFVVALGLSTAFAGAFSADYSALGIGFPRRAGPAHHPVLGRRERHRHPVAHSTEPVTAPGIRARINRTLDQAGAVPHVSGFADPYQEPGAISADGPPSSRPCASTYRYPLKRVAAIFYSFEEVTAVLPQLEQAGFDLTGVNVLSGPEGVRLLDLEVALAVAGGLDCGGLPFELFDHPN